LDQLKSNGEVIESEWTRLKGPEISLRNRYPNVDSFSANRVKLLVAEGQCDYINASPIRIPHTNGNELKYIATQVCQLINITRVILTPFQGPRENTVAHFWRMILDLPVKTPVIIMLTQWFEGNREKCFQYFPLDDSEGEYPLSDPEDPTFNYSLVLKSLEHHEETESVIRTIEIRDKSGKTVKSVKHLFFEGWPDFSVPEDENKDALLKLIKLSKKLATHNGKEEERVVHCSAGVGRSGSFIALDWLMQELQAGRFDDAPTHMPAKGETSAAERGDPIADLVNRMRGQRMMMVQSESQFAFLYDVLAELWMERWNEKHGVKAVGDE
jgi:protein-tyrosine phosphatase